MTEKIDKTRINPEHHADLDYPIHRTLAHQEHYHGTNLRKESYKLAKKLLKTGDLKPGDYFNVLEIGSGGGLATTQMHESLTKMFNGEYPGNLSGLGLIPPRYIYGQLEKLELKPKVTGINLNIMEDLKDDMDPSKNVVADAQQLPYKDNSTHLIMSIETAEYVPDKLQMFKEAHRVLHPKGKAYIHYYAHQLEGITDQDLEKAGLEVRKPYETRSLPMRSLNEHEKKHFRILVIDKEKTPKLKLHYEFQGHKPDPHANMPYRISIYKRRAQV